jgi:hypothetical protein
MLKAGERFNKRVTVGNAIEKHGNYIGKHAKLIHKLSGGYGIHFRCVSFDEINMECACSYSVYFAKSRKKSDNVKEYDENGTVVDNSVWFIPLKSKICTTHSCSDEASNENEASLLDTNNQTVNQIDWNAFPGKFNYNFRNIFDETNSDEISFYDHQNFKGFEVPKLKLSFESANSHKSENKYSHFKHPNKMNRVPKLIRATTQPPQKPQLTDEHIKSELAILLEELDAQYRSLVISNVSKDDVLLPVEDPIMAHENEIASVKLAIQEKLKDNLFVFDEITINTEESGKQSDCWNLERDIESWRCNSKWWDVCISNFPLGEGLNVVGWDHDNNRFSLYYNDYFSMSRCASVKTK